MVHRPAMLSSPPIHLTVSFVALSMQCLFTTACVLNPTDEDGPGRQQVKYCTVQYVPEVYNIQYDN
jgi:hypothetical protein